MDDTGQEVRLELPDGSLVLNNGKVVKPRAANQPAASMSREIQSGRQAARILNTMSRKLGDLPETPEKMNAFGAVVVYSMIGISDEEIALALNTTPERIKMLKELDAYQQLVDMLDQTVIEDGKRAANQMVAKAVTRATQRMIEGVDSEREDIAIVAARDIMKAAGVGAADESNKRVGGLNIIIKRAGEKEEEIKVELTQ